MLPAQNEIENFYIIETGFLLMFQVNPLLPCFHQKLTDLTKVLNGNVNPDNIINAAFSFLVVIFS